MKRLLAFIAFIALIVAIDFALGLTLERLYARTMTGERGGLTNYALAKDTDILVLGSSRAQFHVMPSMLAPELGMRVFNAGLKGHDFLYSIMLLDLWKRRHRFPRAVVLVVDPETMGPRETELAAEQLFGPYIDQSELVREVLYSGDRYKRFEYLSRAYRYNGKVLSILKNQFVRPDAESDGFLSAIGVIDLNDPGLGLGRHGMLDVSAEQGASDELALATARRPFVSAKVRYLRQLVDECRRHGSRLFLIHTPIVGLGRRAHDVWLGRMQALLPSGSGAELLDFCEVAYPSQLAGKPQLFKDFAHLNEAGAKLFSGLLASELKSRLSPAIR
jgi:hypothetical protein